MKIVELILDENQEESGIEAISIVESPAIEEDFIALKSNEIKLAEIDKEKKILMGALLIPNKPIYRNNGEDEYYIYFSKDTVLKASQMYLTKGNQNNSTLEHQHSLSGLSLVESWLVEDEVHDKSRKYGMNVPVGTWMGAVKVNNDEVWNDYVKTGKVKGFSIEGYFADKMERPKESIKEDMSKEKEADLLLSQIEKIVKGEKVELALVDDAKKIINKVKGELGDTEERAFDFIVDAENIYKKALNEYEQQLKDVERITQPLEKAIQEIGINRSTFGVLDDLDESKNKLKERIKIVQKNISKIKSINFN
jgi:hypothetical protein